MAVKVIGAGLAGCEAAWQSVWDDASAGLLNAANSPIFSNKRCCFLRVDKGNRSL